MKPKVKYPELLLKLAICLTLFFGIHSHTLAQSNSEQKKSDNEKKEVTADTEELLDTDETILYVGEKMMYQLKKKLHLSDEQDEEEEKKRKEKAKNVKFSLFGITIEKG